MFLNGVNMLESGVFLLQLIILDFSSFIVKRYGFNLPPVGHYSWSIGTFSIIAILMLKSMWGWGLAAMFLVMGVVSKRVSFYDFVRMACCIVALFGLRELGLTGWAFVFLNALFVFFIIIAEILVYSRSGDVF